MTIGLLARLVSLIREHQGIAVIAWLVLVFFAMATRIAMALP